MKQSLLISIVVGLQLSATLATQLLIVRMVGVGPETDAYIAAQAVPSVLSAIIISALQSVWLPRMSVLSQDVTALRCNQAVAQGQALILGAGVFCFIWLGAVWWLSIFFPGLSVVQLQIAYSFTGPLFITSAFNIQAALLTIALRASNRFLTAEIVATMGTAASLVLIFFALPQWGLEVVPWIFVIRAIAVYLIQLKLVDWPTINIKKGWACKDTWYLMRPLLIGASIYKTTPIVDRFWTSQAPVGGMTTYSLAQTVIGSFATIIERSICVPVKPALSRYVEARDYESLRTAYRAGIRRVTMMVVLLGAILLGLHDFFLSFATELLKISVNAAFQFWLICIFLLGYLHVAASGTIAVATYYALGDTKTPVNIGIIGFFLGLLLKWIMFKSFGLVGLACATSLYFIFNIFQFTRALEKKISRLVHKNEA